MNRKEFDIAYMQYLMFDDPIPYKDFLIYPVTMKDFVKFNVYVKSIIIDKNNIPDVKIISMSYLDFLFYNAKKTESGQYNLTCMLLLLMMCLKVEPQNMSYSLDIEKNNFIKIKKDEGNIVNITCSDFDEIRKIICYQNDIDYPDDDPMNPDIKKAIEEMKELQNRNQNKMGTIDHQINYFISNSKWKKEDIKNLSIRSFYDILSIQNYSYHYNAMLNGQYSGMVKFDTSPKSPLCDLRPEDKNAAYTSDYNALMDKVNKANG